MAQSPIDCLAAMNNNSAVEHPFGELTSLNWLQNISVLNDIESCEAAPEVSPASAKNQSEDKDQNASSEEQKEDSKRKRPIQDTSGKPPYSFASLIFMAIEASPSKCLPVKDIYTWIVAHFPYFRSAAPAWKNSVRHNLSLNKCFKKKGEDGDGRAQNLGCKGSLWIIDLESRDILLQQLKKTGAIQAGLHRTVEDSKGFWADSLRGSGYCGDDESEVIDALCGIENSDEDRIILPPRPRSCPPKLDDSVKIPSWMVKLRLSPYMAANTNKKLIRPNRVLYGGSNGAECCPPPEDRASTTLHDADDSRRHGCASSTSGISSGTDNDGDRSTPPSVNGAFLRSDGRSFGSANTTSNEETADAGSAVIRPPPCPLPVMDALATAESNTTGSAATAAMVDVCEEDRAAAKNLMSLLTASVADSPPPDKAKPKSRSRGAKRKATLRQPKQQQPQGQQDQTPNGASREEPEAKRVCEANPIADSPDIVEDSSPPAVGRTSSGGRHKPMPVKRTRYLEGVEKGSIGVRRGSRKSIKSTESAFTNVATKPAGRLRKRKSSDPKPAFASAPDISDSSSRRGVQDADCPDMASETQFEDMPLLESDRIQPYVMGEDDLRRIQENIDNDDGAETVIIDVPPLVHGRT